MLLFEKKILNSLLDSYENSTVFRQENKIKVQFAYNFTKKNLPEYFADGSIGYEEIHARLEQLEHKKYLTILWKNGKRGHIISKVFLNMDSLPEIYEYLGREPKRKLITRIEDIITLHQHNNPTPTLKALLDYLGERLNAGKSVREYVDIANPIELEKFFKALRVIESNTEERYYRELSQEQFSDSKYLESIKEKLAGCFRRANLELAELTTEEILAEHQIYPTPGYVYIKGLVAFRMGQSSVFGKDFAKGFGLALSVEELDKLDFICGNDIERVYTIENLTSFFRFPADNCIVLYLGGYHNKARRNFLQKLRLSLPQIDFYHFGDIDAGGYYIYHHLIEKSGIPFKLYKMNREILREYSRFGKQLTDNDRIRLHKLLTRELDLEERLTILYMLEHNIKLEQECIFW